MIGAHLLFELVKREVSVRAMLRRGSDISKVKRAFSWYADDWESLFQKVEWVNGDLLDFNSLVDALDDVTHVFHCAGLVSFKKSDYHQLILTNQLGTANLVNACLEKGNIRFGHVSSVSALGRTKSGETINESSFWKTSRNNSTYSISKYGAEREVWRAAEEGLEMFVVSPSVVVGAGEWENGSSQLFSTIYKGVPVYTSGITGYVDVRDVARIMILLMDSKITGERYVISSEDVSYQKMIGMIANSLRKKPPRIQLYPWMAEIAWRLDHLMSLLGKSPKFTREIARSAFNRFYFDNSKIRKLLDYQFITIEESVADTAKIFLSEQKKKQNIRSFKK